MEDLSMNMTPYLIASGIICMIALIITILVGINPNDKTYQKTTKNRLITLSSFYVIAFIPAVFFAIIYFALR